MPKEYNPEAVEEFQMFNVEIDEWGHELWYFRPTNHSGYNVDVESKLPMHTPEGRAERVEQLRLLYAAGDYEIHD
jgi:hypothetical protein